VDAQRGGGVHARSIEAIRLLNLRGYGISPDLPLHLVYNPGGPKLPPAQAELETDYRRELHARWGISFTRLLSITNMPIGRFLVRPPGRGSGIGVPQAPGVLVQPGDRGGADVPKPDERRLGRDDLRLRLQSRPRASRGRRGPFPTRDLDPDRLGTRTIVTGEHCFGCTAGHGSSCAGALA